MDYTRVEFDLVGMTCAACAARIQVITKEQQTQSPRKRE
jgi:hypothetical protein